MANTAISTAQNVFVIAQQGASDLVTAVFSVGADESDEALAVFTSRRNAQRYLEDAGWTETDTVAELQPADFAEWLLTLPDGAPTFLTINPTREEQQAGVKQPVVRIDELVREMAGAALQRLQAPTPGSAATDAGSEYHIFTCQLCGHIQRQPSETAAPDCCGEPMTLAARDAELGVTTVHSTSPQ